jgi:hypothetical protein
MGTILRRGMGGSFVGIYVITKFLEFKSIIKVIDYKDMLNHT